MRKFCIAVALLLIALCVAGQTRVYGPGSNPREPTSIAWNSTTSNFEAWDGSLWRALEFELAYTLPAPSTSGNVLTSNGTAWASAAVTHVVTASLDGIQAARTGALRWYPPAGCTLVSCTAFVGTAPTGGALTVDVNKNGTSALASPLSIAAGGYSSTVTTPTTTAMTATDYLTVDVDSIGSTEPGRDLTVRIVYTIP